MSRDIPSLSLHEINELRRLIRDAQRPSSSSSTSSVARSLLADSALAQNVGRVINSSHGANDSSQPMPILPSMHQPSRPSSSMGRFVPYGKRKKKESRSYDMKLVIVDFIKEVSDDGLTKKFNGNTIIEAPFRVQEQESDASICGRVLRIIHSRYESYDGSFYYASRTGRSTLNVSPCQTLDGKAVYTIKSKSTNNLYIMLTKPARRGGPRSQEGEDEEDEENEDADLGEEDSDKGLLRFSHSSTPLADKDRGRKFRRVYLPSIVPGANSPEKDSSFDSPNDDHGGVVKPFCGHDHVQPTANNSLDGRGFYNPDGKSCGIAASLSLLQYIKPFMNLVTSRKEALSQELYEIYQLRGLKNNCLLQPFNKLRDLLGLPSDEDIDASELMFKLLWQILKDEDDTRQIFCGKRKARISLDSSKTGEVNMEHVEVLEKDDDPVHSLGLPPSSSTGDVSLRDLLSQKLNETRAAIPYSEWDSEWKEKYKEDTDAECHKSTFFDPAPRVAVLTLERGTKTADKKDNRPVLVPRHIPVADFTHPEDECVHSVDVAGGSLFLFRIVLHSEVRNHNYSMVRGVNDSSWIVHDDLKTYEVDLTDDLLKNIGGRDRKDSSISFIYIENGSDLAVEKPPLPDKTKQKEILKRYGSKQREETTADCVILDDDKEVDYQKIFQEMEASTNSFVGLKPLKSQFLRFAKTAILNEKRKRLGFNVDDMSTCLHFIFQGNPGTGKTTFARKVADLLYSVKKIKKRKVVEVQRGDLVGQYIGSTEEKTSSKIQAAKGGVLFVDEAYRLIPRSEGVDYGRIAINQLMAAMEKGDPVMIFAGYPAEMKEFLKANPGLNSRIEYKFTFPDYSVEEMATILENGIEESGYRYDGASPVANIIARETTKDIRSQQNGRLVKNILAEAIINLSNRLSFGDNGIELVTLRDDDVIQACRTFCEPVDPPTNKDNSSGESQTTEKAE